MMSTVNGLRALVAAVVLAGLAGVAAAGGEPLSEGEITSSLAGITLDGVYQTGGFFTETYAADGTIRYLDGNGRNRGSWSIKEGMFCTFYESQDGACFFVRREGPNCYAFYEPKVGPGDSKVPQDRWTSRGWDRASPSTCTESREGST